MIGTWKTTMRPCRYAKGGSRAWQQCAKQAEARVSARCTLGSNSDVCKGHGRLSCDALMSTKGSPKGQCAKTTVQINKLKL
jgi:hypothetical protein